MNLESLFNYEILELLPHKLQVKFAYECCLEIKSKLKDPRSLRALEVIDKWLRDEATEEEIKKAKDEAYHASYAAANANYAATNAISYTVNAISYTASAASYAADAASYAADAVNSVNTSTRDRLFKFIDKLSDIEKMLYFC